MLPWGTKVPVLSGHFLSPNIYFFYFGKIGILHCSLQILCLGSLFPRSTWVKELAFKYVWQSTAHGLLHFLFLFFLGWAGGLITVFNKPQESVNRLHTSLIRFDCFALALPLLKKNVRNPLRIFIAYGAVSQRASVVSVVCWAHSHLPYAMPSPSSPLPLLWENTLVIQLGPVMFLFLHF